VIIACDTSGHDVPVEREIPGSCRRLDGTKRADRPRALPRGDRLEGL